QALGDKLAVVFDKVVPDSDPKIVNLGASIAREHNVDGIVSVGGGSSIDTAKAIAVLILKDSDDILEHMKTFKVGQDVLPHVAIPTTAGTGSECTGFAIVKDHQKGVKLLLMDDHIIPPVAILDPELLVSLPPKITAGTGMDALTHAIEAILSTKHMPPTDALAASAIDLVMQYLPRAVDNGKDLEARGQMQIASAMAGQAFQNAYVGVVHALAHAIGGKYGVPHGLGNALMLAPGMEYNLPACTPRFMVIARAMGITPSSDQTQDAHTVIERIRELNKKIGLDMSLSEAGVKAEGLQECAEMALVDASIATNPKKAEGPEELVEIYKSVL
ncbi:MAG: iron-containing alcohol dehydrogenase, partial [bacterium]|nr:iron-containing alcohol dehydrogenase [bacterium]